jgi:hypothetical protein
MAPESMASAKRTPRVSRISRGQTVAYARKQKPTAGGEADGAEEPAVGADAAVATAASSDAGAEAAVATAASSDAGAEAAAAMAAIPDAGAEAASASVARSDAAATPPAAQAGAASSGGPAAASATAPQAGATPQDEPVEPVRARVTTDRMPTGVSIGAPPAMPAVASTPSPAGSAEAPTRLPGPREIPDGHPDDPAAPPGRVPPGDSRSLRRRVDRHEFALVYRIQTFVISRVGVVGTRGQWRVVEYPTPSMASHAYAKECSRFVSDGFSDYRE